MGDVSNNYALKEDSVVREVKNVTIKDASINAAGLSSVYAAGLIAYANNGFTIDNCDVQGTVAARGMETTLELTDYAGVKSTTSANTKSIYAGGLIGYGLRGGLIKNSAADVDVTAAALDGAATTVYAGGLFGMDNRATAINDYATGDVAATAAENRAYVGGLTGYSAGAHYNVYTAGNTSSTNASDFVGGTSGIFKMVGADFNVFYNGDAAQTVAGAAKTEPGAYGAQDADAQNNTAAAKTAAELASAEFASTMNEGIKNVATMLPEQISEDPIHYCYYTGTGADLRTWVAENGLVKFQSKAQPQKAVEKKANAITGVKASYARSGNVSKATGFALKAKALGGTVSYKSNSKSVKVTSNGKVTIPKNFTGTAKITVSTTGNSNYKAAAKQVTVNVKPGKMAVKSAKNVKTRSMKVAWKKMSGADKYQVRIATNKKMTKGKKTYNVKASASSKKITKLKKGKTYFVQVRTYDKQSKAWSAWSSAKKVKMTK